MTAQVTVGDLPVAPKRVLNPVVVVLALALVAALVALGLVWRGWQHQRDLADAGDEAEAAARSAIVAMTSYDYTSLDADFAWVDTAGTAAFRTRYADASAPIKKLILGIKAHAEGAVIASAATVKDTDHATVLLFVDQEISHPGQAKQPPEQPRVTMSMVRQGGRWLVDDVEIKSLTGS